MSRGAPQLVFHIGDPKTGTSSIQTALRSLEGGSDQTEFAPWHELNATRVAQAVRSGDAQKIARQFSAIRTWLDASHAAHAIISSEFFCDLRPRDLWVCLETYLPEYVAETRVIAYARPHGSRFMASYLQRTKMGLFLGEYDAYYRQFQAGEMGRYAFRFGRWRRHFGENFTLRPFVRDHLQSGDVVEDFFHQIAPENSLAGRFDIRENLALTDRSLSGLRLLQRRLDTGGVPQDIRALVGGVIGNEHLPQRVQKGAIPALDRRAAEQIKEDFWEDAVKVDRNFFQMPIMKRAMKAAIPKAGAEAPNFDPQRHFTEAEITGLQELADRLARLLPEAGRDWLIETRLRRGIIRDETKWIGRISKVWQRRRLGLPGQLSEVDRLLATYADCLC